MHSILAVTTDGLPLGLAAIKFRTRDTFKGTAALKRKVNPTRIPIGQKESYRWLENVRQSTSRLQASACRGFNPLLDPKREPGPITPALCWSPSRRKFFELADLKKQARSKKKLVISPMALEAVKRIDALFDIERAIKGRSAAERLKIRKEQSAPSMP